ncbi:hypothetical protein FHS96_000887 [Sphingomonas zeicaulis]|uniref:hypothetical protein n=1 Tax=Sphingomonas zeicaulis TaxID=1632740 RepID=UPI003D232457
MTQCSERWPEGESRHDRLAMYRHYVRRAQASIDAAHAEVLLQRKYIHLEAAQRWTSLAEKMTFVEQRRAERALALA